MKTVNVATLKQQLSSYLHSVEEGENIIVVSHRRPVARMVPHNGPSSLIRPPSRDMAVLRRLKGVRLPPGRTVVETLIEERFVR